MMHRHILSTLTRGAASHVEDVAIQAFRSGQTVGNPIVKGYRVTSEGIVVTIEADVLLQPTKEVAQQVIQQASPANLTRMLDVLPMLEQYIPFEGLQEPAFKVRVQMMERRGLDAYQSKDLIALLEGRRRSGNLAHIVQDWQDQNPTQLPSVIVTAIEKSTPFPCESWWSAVGPDHESYLGTVRLAVSGGVLLASGEMEFVAENNPRRGKLALYNLRMYDAPSIVAARERLGDNAALVSEVDDKTFFFKNNAKVDMAQIKGDFEIHFPNFYKVKMPLSGLPRPALEELVRAFAS